MFQFVAKMLSHGLRTVIEHPMGQQGQPRCAQMHCMEGVEVCSAALEGVWLGFIPSWTSFKGWQWKQGFLATDHCVPEAF